MRHQPYELEDLAVYNSEVHRGIAHTPEKDAEMAERQRQFNAEQEAEFVAMGATRLADGGWLHVPNNLRQRRTWSRRVWRRIARSLR